MTQQEARVRMRIRANNAAVEEAANAAMDARTPEALTEALADMRMWEDLNRVARNSLRLVVS